MSTTPPLVLVPVDEDTDFDTVWDRLEQVGACDGRGGAEYERVRAEWTAEGTYRGDLESFIRWRANVGPVDEHEA